MFQNHETFEMIKTEDPRKIFTQQKRVNNDDAS